MSVSNRRERKMLSDTRTEIVSWLSGNHDENWFKWRCPFVVSREKKKEEMDGALSLIKPDKWVPPSNQY